MVSLEGNASLETRGRKPAIKLSNEYMGPLLSEAGDLATAGTDKVKAFKSPLCLSHDQDPPQSLQWVKLVIDTYQQYMRFQLGITWDNSTHTSLWDPTDIIQEHESWPISLEGSIITDISWKSVSLIRAKKDKYFINL